MSNKSVYIPTDTSMFLNSHQSDTKIGDNATFKT